ncbi:MAG TPA: hypothetical protein VG095_00755, partial [Chthoniobacterales bacterium]|nr:hypothetical protein [Chthoniobacterales bacterium]
IRAWSSHSASSTDMAATDSQTRFEQPRSTFGTWVGIVLLFAVFGLFVWAVMGMMPRSATYDQKRAEERLKKRQEADKEAQTALAGYGWVDKTKGSVRLPLDRAKELALAELAQKKPAPAGPLPPQGAPGMQVTAPVAPTPGTTGAAASPLPTPHTAIEGKDSETKGKAAAAANPPDAQPGTQPGAKATPAASPPAPSSQPQPNPSAPLPTPVQQPPGSPLPVPGTTPGTTPR